MIHFNLSSLRFKLLLLIAIVLLPLFAYSLYSSLNDLRYARDDAFRVALDKVNEISKTHEAIINHTRSLFTMLSSLKPIQQLDRTLSKSILANLQKGNSELYSAINIVLPNGDLYVSSLPTTRKANYADRTWFRTISRTRSFTIGEYVIGQLQGKPILPIVGPLLDDAGNFKAILTATVNLDALDISSEKGKLPEGSVITVFDQKGTVLMRNPPGAFVGEAKPEAEIVRTALSLKEGAIEAKGVDGKDRLYGFTKLGEAGGAIYISVGIPEEIAFAGVRRNMIIQFSLLGLIALLAFFGAWYIGNRYIEHPIERLLISTRRMAEGDLGVRTDLAKQGGEIGELAEAFDQMADSLQAREATRKRAEAAVRQAKEDWEKTFDAVPDGIMILDLEYRVKQVNRAYAALLGMQQADCLGRRCYELLHGTVEPPSYCPHVLLLEDGQTHTVEIREERLGKDLDLGVSPLRDDDGCLVGCVHIIRDITEHALVMAKLSESESRFSNIFKNASIGMAQVAPDGSWLKVNQALCQMLGYSEEELLQGAFQDLTHPDDLEADLASVRQMLAGAIHTYQMEKRYFRKNGHAIWALLSVSLVRDPEGQPLYFISQIQDITERKQSESDRIALKAAEVLKTSEERFRVVAENLTDVVYDWDIKEKVDWYGDIDGITGYPPGGFPRTLKAWAATLHPEDKDRVMAALEAHVKGVAPYIVEYRVKRRDSAWRWWSARGTALRDEQGEPYKMIGSISDITESKRTEAALRQSEQENALRAELLRQAPVIAAFHDRDNNIVWANQAYEEATGVLLQDIVGKKCYSVWNLSGPCQGCPVLTAIATGKPSEAELTPQNQKQWTESQGYWLSKASPVRDREGSIIGAIEVAINITERKQAEASLRETNQALLAATARANEMATQAEMANHAKSDFLANMSHELRTPLNAIIGFSEVLEDGLYGDLNDRQKTYAHHIYNAGKHLLSLINDILDLSKVEAGKMEFEQSRFPIRAVLDSSVVMMKEKAMKQGIALSIEVEPGADIHIEADERKIKQIVFNLLSNAVKFTPDGGRVTARARLATDEKGGEAQRMLEICIEDTGIGIKEEDLPKLFGEFSQLHQSVLTKGREGTGLGLALSKRFVELHHGCIWVESEYGKGSRFYFTVPVSQGEKDKIEE